MLAVEVVEEAGLVALDVGNADEAVALLESRIANESCVLFLFQGGSKERRGAAKRGMGDASRRCVKTMVKRSKWKGET
jgi:hypothetical protein